MVVLSFLYTKANKSISEFNSFPQISHPSFLSLANNSILGISPQNSTILFLTESGFLLCFPLGSIITLETELLTFGDFPLTPIKHTSALDFVYHPTPKMVSHLLDLF